MLPAWSRCGAGYGMALGGVIGRCPLSPMAVVAVLLVVVVVVVVVIVVVLVVLVPMLARCRTIGTELAIAAGIHRDAV
tara:strand:+ start:1652 stop:1885 length:234 start_codon:yes stop_codon:yes gene_type:complete